MADLTPATLNRLLSEHRMARDLGSGDCMICLARPCHVEVLAEALAAEKTRAAELEDEVASLSIAERAFAELRDRAEQAEAERQSISERAANDVLNMQAALSRLLAVIEDEARNWEAEAHRACSPPHEGCPDCIGSEYAARLRTRIAEHQDRA